MQVSFCLIVSWVPGPRSWASDASMRNANSPRNPRVRTKLAITIVGERVETSGSGLPGPLIFDDFEGDFGVGFRGSRVKDRAQRLCRASLLADYTTEIGLVDSQFVQCTSVHDLFRYGDRVWVCDKVFGEELNQPLE